jgi:hypothetical protein
MSQHQMHQENRRFQKPVLPGCCRGRERNKVEDFFGNTQETV